MKVDLEVKCEGKWTDEQACLGEGHLKVQHGLSVKRGGGSRWGGNFKIRPSSLLSSFCSDSWKGALNSI